MLIKSMLDIFHILAGMQKSRSEEFFRLQDLVAIQICCCDVCYHTPFHFASRTDHEKNPQKILS